MKTILILFTVCCLPWVTNYYVDKQLTKAKENLEKLRSEAR